MSFFFWETEQYLLFLDCVPDHKGQINGFVLQWDCTISPGNRSGDLKKPPTYWAKAMTDKIQLTERRKMLSQYVVLCNLGLSLHLLWWLFNWAWRLLPRLFYRAPLHSAVPTSPDSSCMPAWMTHFCCLCTWSLWECLTGKHFLLTFIHSHCLCPQERSELMRKWLFQEVILGEASLFHFPFVPCLWTEYKRKTLINLNWCFWHTGAWEHLTWLCLKVVERLKGRRKEESRKTSPSYDGFLEDFSPSCCSQSNSASQAKLALLILVQTSCLLSKLFWFVSTSLVRRWSETCRVFKAEFGLQWSTKSGPSS